MLKPLQEPRFMQTFARKGRFSDLMRRMPVHVITARAALVGAAAYGLERLRDHQDSARSVS
jgi:glucokinase